MDIRDTVLHGTALKRHSAAADIAGIVGLPLETVDRELAQAVETARAVMHNDRYALTPLADVALRSRYSLHYGDLRENPAFVQPYEAFERINIALKQVITDWQTMNVGGKKVANDHSDPDYDAQIIDRIGAIHEQFDPIIKRLAAQLPRLAIFGKKLLSALEAAEDGDIEWVSDIRRESYHTVWFELHEDLLRIMGRERQE